MELTDPLPPGLLLLDPVKEVAAAAPEPLAAVGYQHEGLQSFLHGVVDPVGMRRHLRVPRRQPPPGGGAPVPPGLSRHLEAIVRSLRDAEILAVGAIPAALIRRRIDVDTV